MADALDSKSGSLWECGFKSHLRYHPFVIFTLKTAFFSFFASSSVCDKSSYRFLARNFRQLIDFQFEVLTVSEAVSLFYQPSDLVIKSLHFRIADVPVCSVSNNSIQLIPDCLCHGL